MAPRHGPDTGIQPTYEELKHRKWSEIFSKPSRIQPTYEELKPRRGTPPPAQTRPYPAYL